MVFEGLRIRRNRPASERARASERGGARGGDLPRGGHRGARPSVGEKVATAVAAGSFGCALVGPAATRGCMCACRGRGHAHIRNLSACAKALRVSARESSARTSREKRC